MRTPGAPKHLSRESKRLWRLVAPRLQPEGLPLLAEALEALDRSRQAAELVRREGLVLNGKPHPAARIEKEARALFVRCWKALGLDLPPNA